LCDDTAPDNAHEHSNNYRNVLKCFGSSSAPQVKNPLRLKGRNADCLDTKVVMPGNRLMAERAASTE